MKPPMTLPIAALTACLMTTTAIAGPLQNGDFSSGFDAWTGEVTDDSFVDTQLTPAQMAVSPLYQLPGGGAVDLFNDATFFHTSIFQAFDLPNIAAGDALSLSFGYDWALTDDIDFFDFVQAVLDFGGASPIDLFAGLDTSAPTATGNIDWDVTAIAGQAVTLLLAVDDADFLPDRLTIDNITITHTSAAAPAPGTALLLLLALVGMHRVRRADRD